MSSIQQYADIENRSCSTTGSICEIRSMYCNCDDPLTSQFTRYFTDNFRELGLRKLISTCYRKTSLFECEPAVVQIVDSRGTHTGTLRGDGDFRSPECIDYLHAADIIVTNPPFSMFGEYISLLTNQKKFLIVGTVNNAAYQRVFPYIQSGDIWLGVSRGGMLFDRPLGDFIHMGNVVWYTNMDHGYRPPPIELTERYCPERYPAYDNCDAINVDRVSDIPADYDGVMGVPISYIKRHCPEQFAIVGVTNTWSRDQWQTKVYPKQTICRERLARSLYGPQGKTDILNMSPAFCISDPSGLDTYYVVDGEYYRSLFQRILIRRR